MRKPTRVSALLISASAALLPVACGSAYYTQTGAPAAASRSSDCTFTELTTTPNQPYRELGVVEVKPGEEITNLTDFEDTIRPYVCHAGGNAAIVLPPDPDGHYVSARVIALAEPEEVVTVWKQP
jgi:hypothetical protein